VLSKYKQTNANKSRKGDRINPLTTAKANRLARTFLVITRQLLQQERGANPLRIQQV